MSTHTAQYPTGVEFDPAYKKFFEEFYATSDTPDAHEDYVQYFTRDATLIMASKKVVGSEGSPPHCFLNRLLRHNTFRALPYHFLAVTDLWF
jgi:hypothetical protein